jgi:hypothetical protein
VWTYTVLAARASSAARSADLAAASLHRTRLEELAALARRAGAPLPTPAPGYALPADAGTPAQLAQLEESAAAAWCGLVGAADPGLRQEAAQGLVKAARQAAAVAPGSAASRAFPGDPGKIADLAAAAS